MPYLARFSIDHALFYALFHVVTRMKEAGPKPADL